MNLRFGPASALLPLVLTAGMLWPWSGPARAAATAQAIQIHVDGTVNGAPENVSFLGKASVGSKLLQDPGSKDPPVLELSIDFSGVAGTGVRTGRKYVNAGRAVLHRPLAAYDEIQVSFPFHTIGDLLSARTAVATFNVYFDRVKGVSISAVKIHE